MIVYKSSLTVPIFKYLLKKIAGLCSRCNQVIKTRLQAFTDSLHQVDRIKIKYNESPCIFIWHSFYC